MTIILLRAAYTICSFYILFPQNFQKCGRDETLMSVEIISAAIGKYIRILFQCWWRESVEKHISQFVLFLREFFSKKNQVIMASTLSPTTNIIEEDPFQTKQKTSGIQSYYIAKIDEKEIILKDKIDNLRRLQAQRNELNARGM